MGVNIDHIIRCAFYYQIQYKSPDHQALKSQDTEGGGNYGTQICSLGLGSESPCARGEWDSCYDYPTTSRSQLTLCVKLFLKPTVRMAYLGNRKVANRKRLEQASSMQIAGSDFPFEAIDPEQVYPTWSPNASFKPVCSLWPLSSPFYNQMLSNAYMIITSSPSAPNPRGCGALIEHVALSEILRSLGHLLVKHSTVGFNIPSLFDDLYQSIIPPYLPILTERRPKDNQRCRCPLGTL